ncbi:M16 family metallopeptidase [Deinococcus multiflagellatus]|uniref:M16 family metallopeptidase n=1 Tax=Deinococcus multiflagellatus TaxID=1656887 RepID=A0ABW1ZIF3_9DEIO
MDIYTAGYLDNGLGFLLAPRPGAHLVHLALYFDHGVKDEDPAENGICHLLEHLLFNVNRFPKRLARLFEPLARSGSQFAAYTGKEYTRLTFSMAPEHLERALIFLRALLERPPLEQATLEHERHIVMDEIARKRGRPEFLWNLLEEALFAPPYGLPVLGQPDVIAAFSLAQLKERAKQAFSPRRVRLVLTGRVKAEAGETIHKHLATWTGHTQASEAPSVEILPKAVAVEAGGSRAALYLGFPAPALPDAERPAAEVLAQLLGLGLRSRVFKQLREKSGLAYAVGGGQCTGG